MPDSMYDPERSRIIVEGVPGEMQRESALIAVHAGELAAPDVRPVG